ncbi:MAG: hypothetical protein Q8904_13590, partial [Bacteroidota bacterium]|nr:hypothetical protein [Bacteroidota bacterium]
MAYLNLIADFAKQNGTPILYKSGIYKDSTSPLNQLSKPAIIPGKQVGNPTQIGLAESNQGRITP